MSQQAVPKVSTVSPFLKRAWEVARASGMTCNASTSRTMQADVQNSILSIPKFAAELYASNPDEWESVLDVTIRKCYGSSSRVEYHLPVLRRIIANSTSDAMRQPAERLLRQLAPRAA